VFKRGEELLQLEQESNQTFSYGIILYMNCYRHSVSLARDSRCAIATKASISVCGELRAWHNSGLIALGAGRSFWRSIVKPILAPPHFSRSFGIVSGLSSLEHKSDSGMSM